MKSLLRIRAVAAKEVRQLRRDRLTFGMIIGIPVMQLLLFGYAINMDVRYLSAAVDDVRVTTEVDGLPQRVIVNELVRKLEWAHPLTRLVRALRSGLAFRKASGASLAELLRSALALRRHERLTRAQTLMDAACVGSERQR